MCDGASDCDLGEDESECDIVCEDSKFSCRSGSQNNSITVACINKKMVCNGQKDCPAGDDERDCPTKTDCSSSFNCSQICIVTAEGKDACDCRIGYKLAQDGTT